MSMPKGCELPDRKSCSCCGSTGRWLKDTCAACTKALKKVIDKMPR